MGTKTLMTAQEFDQLPDDGMKHELIEGELVVMPPPKYRHTFIQQRLSDLLRPFVRQQGLGEVHIEPGFRLSAKNTLQPDVAFVRTASLKELGPDGYLHGAPALAVQVVSESNAARDLERKVERYLSTGSEEVWVVYPDSRKVRVYYPDGSAVAVGDRLTSRLFPGWSASIAELFS
jgi:Uma2 family endonuclease